MSSSEIPTKQRLSPIEQCEVIRQTYPQPAEHEFFILTDGSGHTDGFAGSAAIIYSPQHPFCDLRTGAWSGSDTERAEFEALLMALQAILDTMEWTDQLSLKMLADRRPLVHWTSDRQSLVLAVGINPATSEPFYARRSTPDLWARYTYYEKLFRVTPSFESRNSDAWFKIVDVVSSDMRQAMKMYAEGWQDHFQWMSGWEMVWRHPVLFEKHVKTMVQHLQVKTLNEEQWGAMAAVVGKEVWPIVMQTAMRQVHGEILPRHQQTKHLLPR